MTNQINAIRETAGLTGLLLHGPAYQQPYVERLYEAFMSVETTGPYAIIDKPSKTGALAQAAQKIRDKKYPPHVIEEACWEILVSPVWKYALSCLANLTNAFV